MNWPPSTRDDDVVEIGSRPGDPSVVEHGEVVTHERVEAGADDLLALRADVPGARALRLLGDGEQETSDAWEPLSDPPLPGVASPLELTSRRAARRPTGLGLEFRTRVLLRGRHLGDGDRPGTGRALQTADGASRPLVDGPRPGWEVGAALTARAGIPKPHALVAADLGGLPRAHAGEGRSGRLGRAGQP